MSSYKNKTIYTNTNIILKKPSEAYLILIAINFLLFKTGF